MAKEVPKKIRLLISRVIGHGFRYDREINSAEIVSFDVYDTLIFRKTANPEEIFGRIADIGDEQFADRRIKAERKVREEANEEEITLQEIYNELAKIYGKERAESYKVKEIKAELELSYANPAGRKFYRYLLRRKKKIIITSDMYLPEEVIGSVLARAGYKGYERLFVSNQYRLQKKTGNLFQKVIEEMGTHNIVHIGDHLVSDFIQPYKAGIIGKLYNEGKNEILENGKHKR